MRMIIVCSKCKAEFEVPSDVSLDSGIKLQCSECGFSWMERTPNTASTPFRNEAKFEKEKLMKGLGLDRTTRRKFKLDAAFEAINIRNIAFFFVGIAFVVCLYFIGLTVIGGKYMDKANSEITNPAVNTGKSEALKVEITRPLVYDQQGSEVYVMLKGFVHNPTQQTLSVPKLIIRLLNRQGRVLQEQEREIEAKELEPGHDADFSFRIYMFSDQIYQFRVDFAPEGKI